MILVHWRGRGKHFFIIRSALLSDSCTWEQGSQWQGKTPLKISDRQYRGYSPTGTQSLHRSYSKHAISTRSLCCFSNNPKRRVGGCPIMNKTADRNGKSLWRIFKLKIPYVESEHCIYTFSWYFAHAQWIKEEIYGHLLARNFHRHSPLAWNEHMDPGQTLICSTKFLFKLKGKVLEDKI